MLDRVWGELVHVGHLDDVFWQVQAIIRDNPRIRSDAIFLNWIRQCYVDSVAIRLRRLGDRRRDAISLWRLLQEMASIASDLTRERYLSLHDPSHASSAAKWWEELTSASKDHVTKELIRNKQRALEATLERVSAFADQNIAHLAAKPTHAKARLRDFRQSIAAIFELYRWCSLILRSEDMGTPVPYIQSNWLRVFRTPWLQPEQLVPKYRKLDDEMIRNELASAVDQSIGAGH